MVHAAAVEEFEKKDVELTVPPGEPRPVLLVVMGPASCGKSTIGQQVADALQLPFIDGDSLHPKSNVDKMSNGIPLTDDDRLPWLALIRSTAERNCKEQWDEGAVKSKAQGGIGRPGIVIGCSALKKWYRDILRGHVEAIPPPTDDLPPNHDEATAEKKVDKPATSNLLTLFLYCHGSPELLAQRIAARKGHFMGARMLESQLATLQDPRGEEGVAWVDIDGTEEVVRERAVKNTQRLIAAELDEKDE
ncbi:P-loop containing nucleoside triphosphate hydrolase protein [Papiliotrema laurentii]|uniref:gluconokinase n=1 Tax=Papiliotrema laurentii TaxID=5418 RepID=A0AAD9L9Y4_PAPLA|nr:P-loop containing nucleoside triphosphate hydrolase protein [Papiliotrema laurentii]